MCFLLAYRQLEPNKKTKKAMSLPANESLQIINSTNILFFLLFVGEHKNHNASVFF